MAKLRWKEKTTRMGRLTRRNNRRQRKRDPKKWRGKQLHPRYMLYWVALFDMLERRFRRAIVLLDGGENQ